MQVFPTAPSPTVTHLMNLEVVEAAIEIKATPEEFREKERKKGVFLGWIFQDETAFVLYCFVLD